MVERVARWERQRGRPRTEEELVRRADRVLDPDLRRRHGRVDDHALQQRLRRAEDVDLRTHTHTHAHIERARCGVALGVHRPRACRRKLGLHDRFGGGGSAAKGRGDCGCAGGRGAHPDKARRAVLLQRGERALDRVEHVAQLGARPAVGEEGRRGADHLVEARGAVRLAHERLGQREARRLAQLARARLEATLVDDVLHHLVHRADALKEGAQPGEADPADAPLTGGEPLLGGEDGQGDALPRGGERFEQADRQLLQLLLLCGERRQGDRHRIERRDGGVSLGRAATHGVQAGRDLATAPHRRRLANAGSASSAPSALSTCFINSINICCCC